LISNRTIILMLILSALVLVKGIMEWQDWLILRMTPDAQLITQVPEDLRDFSRNCIKDGGHVVHDSYLDAYRATCWYKEEE